MKLPICVATLILLSANLAWAEDWPQFAGPNRDNKSSETGLLKDWPAQGPALATTIRGIGRGYSSVAVVAGNVYATGILQEPEGGEYAFRFDETGRQVWKKQITPTAAIGKGVYDRSTPTFANGKLFIRCVDGAAVCLNADDGSVLWRVDVIGKFKGKLIDPRVLDKKHLTFYGNDIPTGFESDAITESLLVEDGKVFCTAGGADACLVALNPNSGETIWTSKGVSDPPSCCSPIAFDFGGVRQVCTVTAAGVIGVRPSDGSLLWRQDANLQIACPQFVNGTVFLGGGPGGSAGGNAAKLGRGPSAVRLTSSGSDFKCEEAFAFKFNNAWGQGGYPVCNTLGMGCVFLDGYFYGSSSDYDHARSCVELASGREVSHVLEGTLCGRATGPVIYVDGHLYYQSEFGVVRRYIPSPTAKPPLADGSFNIPSFLSGRTIAHPAFSNGKLYIRYEDKIFVYDLKTPAPSPAPSARTDPPAIPTAAAEAGDWPCFRGPHRDGRSSETGLLKKWPAEGPPLVATLETGTGSGSPAIVGDRVYISGTRAGTSYLYCFKTSGEKIWETVILPKGQTNNERCADSTPTVDGDTLYFLAGNGTVFALETETGKQRWQLDLVKKFKGQACWWAYTESVLIDGNNLICSAGGPDAALVALDKKTGETVWTTTGVSDWAANGSPILFEYAGRKLVCAITARSLICVDAATGKLQFRWDRPSGANPFNVSIPCEATGGHNVSTPFYQDGYICGFNIHTGGGAIKLFSDGDKIGAEQVWDSHAIWPKASGYMTLNGNVFGCSLPGNGAAWVCLDLRTGKQKFYTPTAGLGGPFIYADGMFYCTSFRSKPDGVTLIEMSETELKVAGTLLSPTKHETISYPALSHGRFYLRPGPIGEKVYVYDVRANRP
jgi:outer membrane protein assembly factor BamB